MPLTFVTYSRVSTREQDDSFSPITQENSCTEFGMAQGWKPYKNGSHFHDTQTGVSYEKREQLQKVISLVKAGLVQRVIINDIDRAGRDTEILNSFVRDLYKNNARPIVALDKREFTSAIEFSFAHHFQIAVAQYSKNKIIIETRRGMKTAFKAGAFLGSPYFGYERLKVSETINNRTVSLTKLAKKEIDADLVRQGLEIYADTQSYRQAAILLNKYNLDKNPTRKRSFITSSMTRMFENLDIYLGLPYVITRTIDDETMTYIHQHQPIITQELADRVRKANTLRARDIGDERVPKPFRRLIHCLCCGSGARIATKNPGNTDRVGLYHYTNCYSLINNKMYVRQGLPHLIKEIPCVSEITAKKFIKILSNFLTSLDDDLFQTQIEEMIANRILETKYMIDELGTLEANKRDTFKEQKEIERKIILADNDSSPRVMKVFEGRLEKLENELEENLERTKELGEILAKEISNLSRLGISQEMLEDIEIDDETREYIMSKFEDNLTISEEDSKRMDNSYYKSLTKTHSLKIRDSINALRISLKNADWDSVNGIMADIGLSFVADYSERDRVKRTNSIRLVMRGNISPPFLHGQSPP